MYHGDDGRNDQVVGFTDFIVIGKYIYTDLLRASLFYLETILLLLLLQL